VSAGAREQVTRLLALVPYLQRGEGVPLRRVAADFGVDPEQIRNDLRVLWMCGLPGLGPGDLMDIDFEAFEEDPDGLVTIDNAEYLSRPLRLGSSEASALIVALRALREGSPAASREVVDRVLVKLEEATASSTAPVLEAHLTRTHADEAVTRTTLEQAIGADRQVRLEYYVPSRDETTDRVVDPLAVLQREGHGYLDAWCHLASARRTFRLDRIDAVEVLDAPRLRPDEPPRELGAELFESSPHDLEAVIRLGRPARWVAGYYPVESVVEGPDGSLDVTLRAGDPRWLVRLVLGLAPDVTVLSPPGLREEVAARARAALALYDAPPPAPGDVA
jgi:proteasome accessory factor C